MAVHFLVIFKIDDPNRSCVHPSPQELKLFNLADQVQTRQTPLGSTATPGSYLGWRLIGRIPPYFWQESIGDRLSKLAHGAGPSRRKRHLKEKSEQKPAVSRVAGQDHTDGARSGVSDRIGCKYQEKPLRFEPTRSLLTTFFSDSLPCVDR